MATKETKTVEQTSEVIEPVVAEPKTESEPTGWTVSVNNNDTSVTLIHLQPLC